MAKGLLPWRALRPVLLAGAATLTWLTLSGTAATADSADSDSLLGGVTSSVSSLAAPLTSTLAPPPAAVPAPSAVAPSGLVQPVVGALTGATDRLAAAVPGVNNVVPAGSVSAVAVPVAVLADDATAALVERVAPPLVEAVPILEPVVQPVSDLVTGTLPLPVTLPVVTDIGAVLPDTAGVLNRTDSTVPPAISGAPTDIGEVQSLGDAGVEGSLAQRLALAVTSASPAATVAAHRSAGPESPLTGELSPFPAPAGPSSGAGSGTSASGPAGPAAWLHDFDLDLPLPGSFAVTGASEHSPSPVSFDPGSSPD